MAHYAQIDDNNIVLQVIVADQDYIDSGQAGDPTRWIQTSYNTRAGVHILGGTPLRKNYAGIGYTYDSGRDAFIPPKPYPSWQLNETTCQWNAPVEPPLTEFSLQWNETEQKWEIIE